ncbi:hypothetical protein [Paenibacillus alvei]|nr:hypothetical protein [Paenibacillus alvei]MEC0078907.1 hypothetical protein [Paenibacillus alvei]
MYRRAVEIEVGQISRLSQSKKAALTPDGGAGAAFRYARYV